MQRKAHGCHGGDDWQLGYVDICMYVCMDVYTYVYIHIYMRSGAAACSGRLTCATAATTDNSAMYIYIHT